MSSFNRVLLMGTLGQNPILKSTQSGKPFCRLSLATDSFRKDDSGENGTSWHSVHVFGKQAENASQYLRKGRQVLIEGRIDSTSSQKNGARVWQTWITADRVTFLSGKASKYDLDGSISEQTEATSDKETEIEMSEETKYPISNLGDFVH